MKKTFYNVLIFIFHIITITLLLAICVHFDIIKIDIVSITKSALLTSFRDILKNDYVINILCTIITAVALYFIQIKYSKYKLKKDFRCNEIIHELYSAIEETQKLLEKSKKIKQENFDLNDKNNNEFKKLRAQKYIDFYSKEEESFSMINLFLTNHNNDILIDSVQTVFFINLNFKLLNIINNIKNRKPNLVETLPKIKSKYALYKDNNDDISVFELGRIIEQYLIDVKFMTEYYLDLLNYLEFDPVPVKLFIETFNEMYPKNEEQNKFFSLSVSEQIKITKKINMIASKKYMLYRFKNFFKS